MKKQIRDLSKAFSSIDDTQVPEFSMHESLNYSYYHIDHNMFKKYGLDSFEKHPTLSSYKENFNKIRELAKKNKHSFKDDYICKCCGEQQKVVLPEELLQYKFLMEDRPLAKKIGLLYFKDFIENYLNNLAEKFTLFFSNINIVDKPDCVILVEGESEEISIPILAFRSRIILAQHNILVYNSKSKEKLSADFFSMKSKYPNRKIICLLDSDATKERDDIERVIKEHKDKYRLIFIEKGTFEDLFDIDCSIEILNELYPDGDRITKSDFDFSKDFLTNVKRFMFSKKKAQFDKVQFAERISLKIDVMKIPNEINKIFELAKRFTKPAKFINK